MAQTTLRTDLHAASFPMVTELWGRTVIVKGTDENDAESTVLTNIDKGIPQAFYMHNCMPTSQGYQAIGYELELAGLAGHTDFDQSYPLQNSTLNKFLFVPAGGLNYIFDRTIGVWESVSPIANVPTGTLVTVAFVEGQSYIFYSGIGCFVYDEGTRVLDPVTLSGLDISEILGICAANGYMIAFTTTSIAWSSITDPTDFTPSLETGAGGGSVADAKGAIIVCLPLEGGFIVYCEKNAVGSRYTGNAQFPYNLNELPGSSGVIGPEQVSWQSNIAVHYVWSTAGLMQLDLNQAINIYPDITDFLAGRIYEDFDEVTLEFTQEYLTASLNVKLNVVSSRFVVISYGLATDTNFQFALVLDLALGRFGKLKIEHRDCFQWNNPNLFGSVTWRELTGSWADFGALTWYDLWYSNSIPDLPKRTLAFMQQDGTVLTVNFDLSEATADGVLLLGKYQMVRQRFITHQYTDVETIDVSRDMDTYIIPTLDGKTMLPASECTLIADNPKSRRYARRISGMNYSILVIGSFNLTSVITTNTLNGVNK